MGTRRVHTVGTLQSYSRRTFKTTLARMMAWSWIRWAVAFLLLATSCHSQSDQTEFPMNQTTAGAITKLQFLGKSPQFRVYYADGNETKYMQFKFGKIEELTSTGVPVQGHKIASLASQSPRYEASTLAHGNQSLVAVSMTLDLSTLGPSFRQCGNRRLLKGKPVATGPLSTPNSAQQSSVSGSLGIVLYMNFTEPTDFQYGASETVTVPANSIKYNIVAENWPFCADTNMLSVQMDLTTSASEAPASSIKGPRPEKGKKGGQALSTELGGGKKAVMAAPTYAYDQFNGTIMKDVDISIVTSGGKTSTQWVFPYFTSLFYDPFIVVTTSSTTADDATLASAYGTVDASAGSSAAAFSMVSFRLLATALAGAFLLMKMAA